VFIGVIPFGGSIDDEGLTYFVRDELAESVQVGCLVEVPFRNALDYAIVTNMEWIDIPENPKSIVRIVTSTPLLSPYQIHSIFDSATYYFVHTHHILSLVLSKTLVKYLEKQDFKTLTQSPQEAKQGDSHNNPIQFYHHTKNTPFFESIQEKVTDDTVLIFPDDFSIEAYLKACPGDPENTLIIYDRLTETKKHKAFISVYNGEKNIIIWTRRILYYNLSRYVNILYIEDALHKTAMRFNHTYNHLEILRRMATESHLKITILSSLPSIESMYYLHTGTYNKTS
jgi:primosomal protein N'